MRKHFTRGRKPLPLVFTFRTKRKQRMTINIKNDRELAEYATKRLPRKLMLIKLQRELDRINKKQGKQNESNNRKYETYETR